MGQEIGVSPLQLVSMVSTVANDGIWTAPRIVAATTEPRSTPQTVVFHPAQQRRVVSPLAAAQMRAMLQRVVESPHGTGKKAVLEGYTAAGKTGTAQKVDPATGAYSHTRYIASFAGFAPVNNPAITVVVILDSPAGLHQGGQVAAPEFRSVAQQVLAYLHVPHDLDIPKQRELLLASRNASDDDLSESSPDRLGSPLEEPARQQPPQPEIASATPQPSVEPAAIREQRVITPPQPPLPQPAVEPVHIPSRGTVVVDVERGGIVVPSFIGKPLRAAVETAENSGLEVDAIGSGVACEQSPAPGTHVPAGAHVAIRFAR
jgi:cell division protein FtsI (penicillin-binding protein 3)